MGLGAYLSLPGAGQSDRRVGHLLGTWKGAWPAETEQWQNVEQAYQSPRNCRGQPVASPHKGSVLGRTSKEDITPVL